MKKLLLIFAILLQSSNLFSQTLSENDSIYLIAIEKYTAEIDSFYLKYSQLKKEEFNTLYWENSDYIYKLPDSIKNHRLIFSDSIDRLDLYRKNGNRLIYHSIFPQFESGFLKIHIVPYIGKLENVGKLMFELSDWTDVFFKFDCNKKRWKYFKTENGGI